VAIGSLDTLFLALRALVGRIATTARADARGPRPVDIVEPDGPGRRNDLVKAADPHAVS
jgi:hypothetical protein